MLIRSNLLSIVQGARDPMREPVEGREGKISNHLNKRKTVVPREDRSLIIAVLIYWKADC